MKKLLLVMAFALFAVVGFSQVSKSDATGETLNGSIASRNFTFTSGEFGGCSSLTEVEVDLTLTVTDNGSCNAGAFGVHGDIAVSLESPSGTVVHLVQDFTGILLGSPPVGITYQDFSFPNIVNQTATYDDDATLLADNQSFFGAGTWRPHNPLSAFDGEDPAGTWILRVADGRNQNFPDFTCYIGATVRVTCGAACTPPTVPTLTQTPATVCNGGSASLNISGTLNDATAWQVYTGACGGTNIGSTTTGTFAIPGTITAPTTYYVRGEGGCVTPGSCGQITITPQAVTNGAFTAPADICVASGVQTGLSGGLPAGGVYSGPGVTDDGNGSTYSFDPAAAGVGTHTITYTPAGACVTAGTDAIEVFALPIVTFTALADICVDAGVQTGLGSGSPAGGIYSGPGVTDNGNGTTYSFNPAAAGVGVHAITYTFTNANGCTASATDQVEVFALPSVTFTALADLCVSDGVQSGLSGGAPSGSGTYSGPGVTDNGNGTYSFDPAVAGVGTHTITFTFTNGNGCSDSATDQVEVFAPVTGTFTALADLCIDAGTQTGLGGGLPVGGVYSGAGVTDDGNGSTYSFNPATAGVGVHTITYTPAGACATPGTDQVEVIVGTVTAVCQDISVYLDAAGNATIVAADIDGGSNVTCGTVNLVASQTTFSCADLLAPVSVTLTVTNGLGGSDNCAAQVTVLDTISPTAVCQDVTVYLDGTGNGTLAGGGGSASVVLNPTADASLNELIPNNNMGAVNHMAVGRIFAASNRRGLIKFDVAGSVPAGATIDSVRLTMNIINGNVSNTSTVGLHPLLTNLNWVEGNKIGNNGQLASAGEVTWNNAAHPSTSWAAPGGAPGTDFTTLPTATTAIAGLGAYNWTGMEADVQGWLDNPATNGGWLVKDEAESVIGTARRFSSKEGPAVSQPALVVYYTIGGGIDGGSFDNCGSVTATPSKTAFTCADLGTNTVTLTVEDPSGNTATCTATVTVEDTLSPTAFTALADLCITDGVQTGLGSGLPVGGVYSGTGVTDDGNGMTYSFDPNAAGIGTHTITYTTSGCSPSITDQVEVSAPITGTFTALADICVDGGVQAGLGGGLPVGGVYSGPGVTDDGNGSTYSFDPAAAGIGVHTITYTPAGSCSTPGTDAVEVFALPTVTFTALADICVDAGVQTGLGSGNPTGGTYSGAGVTDNGNGTSYSFDPAAAGVGTHTITYTFTNGNGCTASATDQVEVFALPTVSFTALADLCINDGVQSGLGGGTPSQGTATGDMGVYSGTGVTDDGNGMTYSFDPAAAGVGTHTITYTYTASNGCTASATDDVEVIALPVVSFTAAGPFCVTQGVQNGLGGGLPAGGVYSGPGVTDNGNGATYLFDPAAAGVGTHTVTYSVITGGCLGSASDDIEVTLGGTVTAVCQNATIYLDANGNATLNPADIDGGSSVGCGTVNLAASQTAFTCADVTIGVVPANDMVITGVYDGPLSNGTPKGVELYVINDIADLSLYGVGSANNGGGSDGQEFAFPAIAATAGQYIYVASEGTQFANWFGFAPDYISGSMSINGDDAVELFYQGSVIDVFGDINTDGSGEAWEFLDGWAYRNNDTGPDGSAWNIANWAFSGINALDGESDNASATTPMPAGSYSIATATPTSVTLTVTDGLGGSATCDANVVILDTISPVANCQDVTVYLDATGNATLTVADITTGNTDNCGVASETIDISAFDCSDVGAPVAVTLTVTDNSGNTATCTSNVTVLDTISPTITCPADIDQDQAAGLCLADVVIPTIVTADNCSGETIAWTVSGATALSGNGQPALQTFSVGTSVVDVVATDASGNTANCTFLVTVNDTVAPVTPVLADSIGECSVTVAAPTTMDACAGMIVGTTTDPTTVTTQGTTVITWTFDDGAGNITTATQNVILSDVMAPTASDIDTAFAECIGDVAIDVALVDDAVDNCTATPIVAYVGDVFSNGTGCNDTIVRVYSVIDEAGNTTNVNQIIILNDVTPPTASNPLTLNVVCLADVPSGNSATAWVTDEADNCGTPTVAWVGDVATNGTGCNDTITRTFDVIDACGNTIQVQQLIIISDDVAPVLDVPSLPDVTGTCDVTPTTPTATDNCLGSVNGVADVAFPINTVGTTVVTWTYTDDCGNSVTQTQNVIVEGVNVSTFMASDGITIVSSNNEPGVTFQWYNCTEDTLMTGETNQNFTPTFSADFAVIVTENGCVDTSACVTITGVGLDQLTLNQGFTMFPNPTETGSFTIQVETQLKTVSVLDMTGRLVAADVNLTEKTVDVSKLVNGAYIVRVVTEAGQEMVGTIRVH